MDPLGCIWMLYVCSGDMVCALETWYVLCGHAICLLGIEYAVWTCYVSSGDGICCVDMLYAFWRWNMLCGHAICLLGIEYALWTCYMSATRSDMYLRENIFEKNGPEKMTLFIEFMFFKSSQEYDNENAVVFAVNFHTELSQIECSC